MLNVIFNVVVVAILLFGFVVFWGAPYLPTLKPQVDDGLDLLDLQPGQTLLELGCGDGRVMLAAAKRGLNVVGYELNPILVVVSWLLTWRYRRQVKVVWGSFWTATWPAADAVYVFLLDKYMPKLDKKIIQQRAQQDKPIKLLSQAFKLPQRLVTAHKGGTYLYYYK